MFILDGEIADGIRAIIENNISVIAFVALSIAAFNLIVEFTRKVSR